MIGTNILTLNMEQVRDIVERHLKDEIFKDGDFAVIQVAYDYNAKNLNVTLGPKETAKD